MFHRLEYVQVSIINVYSYADAQLQPTLLYHSEIVHPFDCHHVNMCLNMIVQAIQFAHVQPQQCGNPKRTPLRAP